MQNADKRIRKWIGLILGLMGCVVALALAIALGLAIRYAVVYYAERRWVPLGPVQVTVDPIDEVCDVMEWSTKSIARSARLYHSITRSIPTSQAQLEKAGALIPPELHHDAFSRRRRPDDFKFRVDGEKLYIWSVGPDRANDGGVIRYDPTNGLKSGGDIITVVEF